MLREDKNKYILQIYQKSLELHRYKQDNSNITNNDDDDQQFLNENGEFNYEKYLEYENEQNNLEQENVDQKWERLDFMCRNEGIRFSKSVYNEIKLHKAYDIYIFEDNPIPNQEMLTHHEKYIPYPHKGKLREAIQKVMAYQESSNLIDYHPNVNDLSGDIQQLVNQEMSNQDTHKIVRVRNIIHQSLQPYNKLFCKSTKQEEINDYFKQLEKCYQLDQWGKYNKISPSQFLWLPVKFTYSKLKDMYEIQGKLFNPLEKYPQLSQLKHELGQLMTYFSQPLKTVHDYFKLLQYELMHGQYNFGSQQQRQSDIKSKVDFSENIHAIVKISEMEIQPNSTYTGQWHVEGFSSDNILYTCLYVIEHDENLVDGKLIFKRTPRFDDTPADRNSQEQCAHTYCPNYYHLCDPNKVIPLGSLDIKENMMIIFPNQNIHKVKGIKNTTDKPLKRKIIAFFVVNNEAQPFTINDVKFTEPIEVIKQNRLRDMYERSKNKQTEAQQFNYCEH